MNTHSSASSTIHPVAKIFRDAVLSPDSNFKSNTKYLIPKTISLGTNANSLLGARMATLNTHESLPQPKFDEYMYTFCTA